MRYSIINNRGVLKEGDLFIINEGKPLELHFDGLPSGEYEIALYLRDGRTLHQRMTSDTALIDARQLRAGIWHVELAKIEERRAVDKIICTPIKLDTMETISDGLIAYPETETLVRQVADLISDVESIKEWIEENKQKIHEHIIIK